MKWVAVLVAAALAWAQPLHAACDRPRAEGKVAEITSLATAQKGEASQLVALGREAVAACDSWAGAHNALATALEASGDLQAALVAYRRAAELDPGWQLPLLGLGDVAKAQGDAAAAEAFYARAAKLSPNESGAGAGYGFADADTIRRELAMGLGASRAPSWADTGPPNNSNRVVREREGVKLNLSVVFAVNSAALLPAGVRQLDEVGRALQSAGPTEVYVIEGHASSEGSEVHNMTLSQSRAEAVRTFLATRYPTRAQLLTVAKGSVEPVIEGGRENRDKSRRVSLLRKQ